MAFNCVKLNNSAGFEQRQNSFGVEDDLEVSLVNADLAGKNDNNRVHSTSVDQTQRTRMSDSSSDLVCAFHL